MITKIASLSVSLSPKVNDFIIAIVFYHHPVSCIHFMLCLCHAYTSAPGRSSPYLCHMYTSCSGVSSPCLSLPCPPSPPQIPSNETRRQEYCGRHLDVHESRAYGVVMYIGVRLPRGRCYSQNPPDHGRSNFHTNSYSLGTSTAATCRQSPLLTNSVEDRPRIHNS